MKKATLLKGGAGLQEMKMAIDRCHLQGIKRTQYNESVLVRVHWRDFNVKR